MDRTTYADPAVRALIGGAFVPIRVDTDRRPDINERYNLGGWPTTAFLTADGRLITGGTFVDAERMSGVLARVADAFRTRAAEWATAGDAAEEGAPAADSMTPADAEAAVVSTFDEEYGGFGVEPKFPHTAPVHLALARFRETGAGGWRHIAERTL